MNDFSIQLKLNDDILQINRKTDSALDWLGAWGGMLDGLHLISELLIPSGNRKLISSFNS